jgi:hypothetical protein
VMAQFEMATSHGYQLYPCHHVGPIAARRGRSGDDWRLSVAKTGMAIPYCNYRTLKQAKASAAQINAVVDLSSVDRGAKPGLPTGFTNEIKKALVAEIERQGLKDATP